eukprot:6173147-Pleurochrysis_carterae.AAC.2
MMRLDHPPFMLLPPWSVSTMMIGLRFTLKNSRPVKKYDGRLSHKSILPLDVLMLTFARSHHSTRNDGAEETPKSELYQVWLWAAARGKAKGSHIGGGA